MSLSVKNQAIMRERAAELLAVPPEHLAWFQYGAAYVASLYRMGVFYKYCNRIAEAEDIFGDIENSCAATKTMDTITRNLLRLGLYWDEVEDAQRIAGRSDLYPDELEVLLNRVREEE